MGSLCQSLESKRFSVFTALTSAHICNFENHEISKSDSFAAASVVHWTEGGVGGETIGKDCLALKLR